MYFESKNSQNSCSYNGPMATVAVVTAVVVTAVAAVDVSADVAHAVACISSNWGHS